MMAPAVLFAGPSLFGSAPTDRAMIERRPPARCGDIARAVAGRPRAIGLLDGVFGTAPSVWHKEILYALAAGIPVLGAASLGAIRAAELHRFGMIGIGAVFAAYRDGTENRDDAVLVLHAPQELGFQPLTVALVDVEASLAAAPLGRDERTELARIARRMPFAERTWDRIVAAYARSNADCATLRALLEPHLGSLKRRDGEALLDALARKLPPPPPLAVPQTAYLRLLLERVGG